MSSNLIYKENKIKELEQFLIQNHIHINIYRKYGTEKRLNTSNLIKSKKFLEYIYEKTNFLSENISPSERLKYFLFDKTSQHACEICNKNLEVGKKFCSTECFIIYYKSSQTIRQRLINAQSILKETIDESTGLSKKQIAANKAKSTIIKNGGIKRSEETKNKQKLYYSEVNPKTGLTRGKERGKKLSKTIKENEHIRDKYVKSATIRANKIVFCLLETKEEWSRAKLSSNIGSDIMKKQIDPITGLSKNQIRILKTAKTKREKTNLNRTEKSLYYAEVHRYTKITLKEIKLDGIEYRGNGFQNYNATHVDHIVSISDGFLNNIPPWIIGSKYNLRCIHWRENISKHKKSDQSIEKLCEDFYS